MKILLAFLNFALVSAVCLAEPEGRYWIQFNPGSQQSVTREALRAGGRVHHKFKQLNAIVATLPSAALGSLQRNPNVTEIEEDPKRFLLGQTTPYGVELIQARNLWDVDSDGVVDTGAPDGRGRIVCIVDSGISAGHEDFAGVSIIGGYPAGWNTDTCGHGTHVAGTIAAANNSLGVVGVSPGATSLYIVKVFDGAACGWSFSSDLAAAAYKCQEAGSHIINMSLGGFQRSRFEQRAFSDLYSAGILSIAAAGNDGNSTRSYPASYDSVISVAAVNEASEVADFSNRNDRVELAAPGVNVMSTVPWLEINNVSVGGKSYSGRHIEFSARGTFQGPLVDGGICDSTGSWNGKVVLCERGTITFSEKVANVQASGGVAALIYNNEPLNFSGTLGEGSSSIVAISLSQADGQELLANSLASVTSGTSQADPNKSGYEAWDGTSMATPHVAGAAAIIWSSDTSKTNQEIRDALTSSALDIDVPGKDQASGFGLIQVVDAWKALGGSLNTNTEPTASFSFNCADLNCSFDASASYDPDGSIVSFSWDFGDGSNGSGKFVSHSFNSYNSYTVNLTVTDDLGATKSTNQLITLVPPPGADTTPPVLSNIMVGKTTGQSFEITWQTDEPANSEVIFDCCGTFKGEALVTSHRLGFRGQKGFVYTFTVRSTDASGNSSTSDPISYP